MINGKPFLTSNLLFCEEIHKLVSPVVNLSQIQKTIQEYRNNVLPTPTREKVKVSVQSGDFVLLKT